uniref:Uncharacterized protein n=1 Tax=Solanum lycopersicum TaxID=4081 RepID=A0A3Q7J994_SOLLC
MLDYLESVLASEHVVVKSGQFIVEVKPQVQTARPNEYSRRYVCYCYVPWRNKQILLYFQRGGCLVLPKSIKNTKIGEG